MYLRGLTLNELIQNVLACCKQGRIVGVTRKSLLAVRGKRADKLFLAWQAFNRHDEKSFANLLGIPYPLQREGDTQELPF